MSFHLAQINLAKMIAPIDSPILADFVANLDRVYAAAYDSADFIWMKKDEEPTPTTVKIFDDELLLVNMSVWKNTEGLFQYVYKSVHADILKRRKEWFEKMPETYMALWYIPEGHKPTEAEAVERLDYLKKHGETPFAFSFKKRFTVEEYCAFIP